ncbi:MULTISPECIES: MFS transporter [unclassified Sphingomonas]|uniref:MFS transporter n=2 Tax=Sphingomonas TaxID=13687 RepID=UPI00226A55F0|nr:MULTISPECIES: MFS transporter [unclassified Sphingomonas]
MSYVGAKPKPSGRNPSMRVRTIVALALSYATLGILMNSVGVVILQSIEHLGATKVMGSGLEACKDLSVVAASFFLATRVAAFGFRRAIIGVLMLMAATCLIVSTLGSFTAMQGLFVMTGLGFGIVKVATYATIGQLARDPAEHAGITNTVEGAFMVGVLAGIWIFSWFVGGGAWLHVYWLLAGLCGVSALLWATVSLGEPAARAASSQAGWREMATLAMLPATTIMLVALFFYVLIEQGVGSWLPTFNREVLHLPTAMSVQMSTIFLASLALGRLASGWLLRRRSWLFVLLACLGAIAVLILVSLPLARGVVPRADIGWSDAPVAAFLFPLLGLFMAPIYPTVCSVALSALPQAHHPAMIGLIVIFSALGGTIGSFLTGLLFQHLSGALAFYFLLVPIGVIAATLPVMRRRQRDAAAVGA